MEPSFFHKIYIKNECAISLTTYQGDIWVMCKADEKVLRYVCASFNFIQTLSDVRGEYMFAFVDLCSVKVIIAWFSVCHTVYGAFKTHRLVRRRSFVNNTLRSTFDVSFMFLICSVLLLALKFVWNFCKFFIALGLFYWYFLRMLKFLTFVFFVIVLHMTNMELWMFENFRLQKSW